MNIDQATFEKYQKILAKDPSSKLFAPLADAFRERGQLEKAQQVAHQGIQLHPDYVGGYTVLSRIYFEQKKLNECIETLNQVLTLAPENLTAYQLLAEAHTELRQLDLALKAHKMALFLNPLNEKSRKAVEKLEVLSAKEYEADVFELKPLGSDKALDAATQQNPSQASTHEGSPEGPLDIRRTLALIDAWIVRGDLESARTQLQIALQHAPTNIELQKRQKLLIIDEDGDEEADEMAQPIQPQPPRERVLLERKIQILHRLLEASRRHVPFLPAES